MEAAVLGSALRMSDLDGMDVAALGISRMESVRAFDFSRASLIRGGLPWQHFNR